VREHLASLVEDFRRNGRETAVVSHLGNRRRACSYAELAVLAGRFAAGLNQRGIGPGERVVLWGANSAEWIAAFFGCLLRGVLAVPLDAAGGAAFAAGVVADTRPRLLAGDDALLRQLPAGSGECLGLGSLATALPAEPDFAVDPSVGPDSPFQIVFTSGTTAEPKGVVHTHRNVLASITPIEREIAKYRRYERWVHPLRFLDSLPLSHVFGQFMGLWIPALLAAEVHFPAQSEPGQMIELIGRERISVLAAVPRVLGLLRTHLLHRFPDLGARLAASAGASAWRRWWRFRRVHRLLGWRFWAVVSGGAQVPEDLEAFWSGLGLALIQGYGLTETAALVTLNHPFRIGHGSIGQPLPGREVSLSDQGEILVRGDVVSRARWQHGEMQPRAEEWLATGDLAVRDAEGRLRFAGRQSDVIVLASGMNVHPGDVEAALRTQPPIREAAVVGCAGGTGMEVVAVLLSSAADSEIERAVAAANRQLAPYQQARRWLRWPDPAFPVTTTGKLLRRQVAAWACARLAAPGPGQPAAAVDALLRMIAEAAGEAPAPAADSARLSEDLRLDSLGRVHLQGMLAERMGVEVADEAILRAETLGELRALLGQPGQPSPSPPGNPAVTPPGEAVRGASAGAETLRYPYPVWPWSGPVRWLRAAFLEGAVRPLIRLLAAPLVECPRPLEVSPPLLIIANHVTLFDAPLVLYALPGRLRRRVAIAMSGERLSDMLHMRNQGGPLRNLTGPAQYLLVTALFNVFPLPRTSGFRRSFEHAGRALDAGYSVLIFPEGRRSAGGRLAGFRAGIGLLAKESGTPVLPVALVGLGGMKSGQTEWFRSGRLRIRVGRPLRLDPAEDPAAITRVLEEAERRLLEAT
jgi:long-chain acyl-CoA synthetase